MKLSSLPWVLVPGMGQIRGGATGLGVALFTLFLLALNGYFLSVLLSAEGGSPLLLLGAIGLWLGSFVDGIRRLSRKGHATG